MIDLQKTYNLGMHLATKSKLLNKMCVNAPSIINSILPKNDLYFFINDEGKYSISGHFDSFSPTFDQVLFSNDSTSLRLRTQNTFSLINDDNDEEILYAITHRSDVSDEILIVYLSSGETMNKIPSISIDDVYDDGMMFQLSTIYDDTIMEFLVINAVLDSQKVPNLRINPRGLEMIWQLIKNSVYYEELMKYTQD